MDLGWWMWPFGFALAGVWLIFVVLALIFWVWMIVDAAKRGYSNDVEKIIWIIVIVLGGLLGSIVYFIVVRSLNPRGIYKNKGKRR